MLLEMFLESETEAGQERKQRKERLETDTLAEPPDWVKERSGS